MRLSDMQKKDIIYLKDGKKLGKIIDAEIEINTGALKKLFVERKTIKSLFTNDGDMLITFNQIKKIGEDVILVDTTR
jgi:YlmC/YmxH family sporulation protein